RPLHPRGGAVAGVRPAAADRRGQQPARALPAVRLHGGPAQRRGATLAVAQGRRSAAGQARRRLQPGAHGAGGAGLHAGRAARLLPALTGLDAELGPELLAVRHGVTRFRITLLCFEAAYRGGKFASPFYRHGRWLKPEELASYPVSTPQRKLIRAAAGAARQL